MSGVFAAESAQVEIYLDDGTGSPSGSALFDYEFRRVTSMQMSAQNERIAHCGYEFDEISAGKTTWRLDLGKIADSRVKDLRLTDALYYIRVILRTDDYSQWDRYNCKKCRRAGWGMPLGDVGAAMVQARFLCEEIEPEAVP